MSVGQVVTGTAAGSASALVRTMRPKQWVKNVFVLAPLIFAQHLGEPSYLVRSVLAMLAFCVLSGAVYAFNDARDVEADRLHPTKRHRPIAAGELTKHTALVWSGALAAGALVGCALLSWPLAAIAALYLLQNVAYSLKLKEIAFVDVAVIASGFLLRVLAGAVAIDVPASGWLLVCTALLATFLGLGKRAHELTWATRVGSRTSTRASLAGYRIGVVRLAMIALAVVTCAVFVAYTLDAKTIALFGTERLVFSTPFVVLGVARFLFLAQWHPKDDPPTDAMLRDPWSLLALAGATATMLYAIYG